MQNVTEERWRYIGGSDIPVIMGLVNYGKTRWDLLLEKAQLWTDDFAGNVYTEYGNTMESKVREYINFMFSTDFVEDKRIAEPYRYHADGWDAEKQTVLEIKTTNEVYDNPRSYKKYLVQLLWGMEMFHATRGILAIYIRPDDFDEEFQKDRLAIMPVEIEDYDDILIEIRKALENFVMDMNYVRENPDAREDTLPSQFALAPLAYEIIKLENSIAQMKEIEAKCKEMKAALKTAMEKAGMKWCTLYGGTRLTLVHDTPDKWVDKFDEKAFERDNPELYNLYLTKKIQKGKSGYVRITRKEESNE